ncbi:hypothetical protein B7494_g1138 [Chlorociboria aeruginascens]|nr:hypothetical protein B7494_g1138 [Chlorociboria aeruginascens]
MLQTREGLDAVWEVGRVNKRREGDGVGIGIYLGSEDERKEGRKISTPIVAGDENSASEPCLIGFAPFLLIDKVPMGGRIRDHQDLQDLQDLPEIEMAQSSLTSQCGRQPAVCLAWVQQGIIIRVRVLDAVRPSKTDIVAQFLPGGSTVGALELRPP